MADEQMRCIGALEELLISTIGTFLRLDIKNIELSGMLPTGQRVKLYVPDKNQYAAIDTQREALLSQQMASSTGMGSPFTNIASALR